MTAEFNLFFKVNKWSITANEKYAVPVSNRNYTYANFEFSKEWDSLTPVAIFANKKTDKAFHVPIILAGSHGEFNRCKIPAEILATKGRVDVGILAGDQAVSVAASFMVVDSIFQDSIDQEESPSFTNRPIMSISGDPVVLASIADGIYRISGSWSVLEGSPVYVAKEDDLFLVSNDPEIGTRILKVTSPGIYSYSCKADGTVSDIETGTTTTLEIDDGIIDLIIQRVIDNLDWWGEF